jgi:hypothetical protein
MFPVYLVKLGLWPLLCVDKEASGYFLTCMEWYGMGYVTGDLVPPDYKWLCLLMVIFGSEC